MTDKSPSCENCYYSLKRLSPLTQTQGLTARQDIFCRRYPPVAGAGYPSISTDDWCGEWHENTKK